MLWPDGRAAAELDRWRRLPADDRAALANPLVPGMTGPVLAWLARHEPELVERASAVLLPKDALRATLLPGVDPAVSDRSDASATLLWDVGADDWSPAAVAAASDCVCTCGPQATTAAVVRRDELFARYGGEEFALVLPESDGPAAVAFRG